MEDVKRLNNFNGFNDLVQSERKYYPTEREAYEFVETKHIEIFGERRYSCYESFRKQKSYHKNKFR